MIATLRVKLRVEESPGSAGNPTDCKIRPVMASVLNFFSREIWGTDAELTGSESNRDVVANLGIWFAGETGNPRCCNRRPLRNRRHRSKDAGLDR